MLLLRDALDEMIAGYSPYADPQGMDQTVICRNIVAGKTLFPRGFDPHAKASDSYNMYIYKNEISARRRKQNGGIKPHRAPRALAVVDAVVSSARVSGVRVAVGCGANARQCEDRISALTAGGSPLSHRPPPPPRYAAARPSRRAASPVAPSRRVAQDLVKKLLVKEPTKRFGCGRLADTEVREHPFFGPSFDWNALLALKVDAPWKPTVKSKTDVSQFEPFDVDETIDTSYQDKTEWDKDF